MISRGEKRGLRHLAEGETAAPSASEGRTARPRESGFAGCAFRERCDFANETCRHTIPRHSAGAAHDFLCRLPA